MMKSFKPFFSNLPRERDTFVRVVLQKIESSAN